MVDAPKQMQYLYSKENLDKLIRVGFQKGHTPWNNGKHVCFGGIPFPKDNKINLGRKHPYLAEMNRKRKGINSHGQTFYRRIAKENLKQVCHKCNSEKQLVVHHKNTNHRDNEIKNLEVLCRSCHNKVHIELAKLVS